MYFPLYPLRGMDWWWPRLQGFHPCLLNRSPYGAFAIPVSPSPAGLYPFPSLPIPFLNPARGSSLIACSRRIQLLNPIRGSSSMYFPLYPLRGMGWWCDSCLQGFHPCLLNRSPYGAFCHSRLSTTVQFAVSHLLWNILLCPTSPTGHFAVSHPPTGQPTSMPIL